MFFTGTRLSTLFGLSLRDPSRVRSVRTLAGASRENGLPFELEIVELAINQGKLTADDPRYFQISGQICWSPPQAKKIRHFWSVSKGETVIFVHFGSPLKD